MKKFSNIYFSILKILKKKQLFSTSIHGPANYALFIRPGQFLATLYFSHFFVFTQLKGKISGQFSQELFIFKLWIKKLVFSSIKMLKELEF